MVSLEILWLLILIFECIRFFLIFRKLVKYDKASEKFKKELNFLYALMEDGVSNNHLISEQFTFYLNHLRDSLGWSYHSIFRLDEQKQLLVIRFTGYLPDWYMRDLAEKVFIKVGDASVGRAVSTKQPATINTTNNDPRFKSVKSLDTRTGYKSLSCYPMIGKLRTYGGFCTYSSYENIFTLYDTQFLMTTSNILTSILETKLLLNANLSSQIGLDSKIQKG